MRPLALFGFLLMVMFHAKTLSAPIANADEAGAADYARYGDVFPSEALFAPALRESGRFYGLIGTQPVFRFSLRAAVERWGRGVQSVRLPAIVPALLGIGVLLLLACKSPWPAACVAAPLLAAGSEAFFLGTHRCRPEGLLFLFSALQGAWLLSGLNGRLINALAGMAGVAAIGCHSAGAVLLAVFAGVAVVSRVRPASHYLWWSVGFLSGALVFLQVADAGAMAETLARFPLMRPLPLAQVAEAPLRSLQSIVSVLGTGGPERTLVSSFYLATAAIALRRWAALRGDEKALCLLPAALAAAFALLNRSLQSSYSLYIVPWTFFACLWAASPAPGRRPLDRWDGLSFAAVHLAVLAVAADMIAAVAWSAVLLATLLAFRRFGALIALAGAAVLALWAFLDVTLLPKLKMLFTQWARSRPWAALGGFFLPWTLAAATVRRPWPEPWIRRGLAVWGVLLFAHLAWGNAVALAAIVRGAAIPESARVYLKSLEREPLVVMPSALSLYAPAVRYQNLQTVELLRSERRATVALAEMKPSLVLLQAPWASLAARLEATGRFRAGEVVDLQPLGHYLQVHRREERR